MSWTVSWIGFKIFHLDDLLQNSMHKLDYKFIMKKLVIIPKNYKL